MKSKLPLSIWVIIPGLNEEKYIGSVLKKTKQVTKNIIVVDDGSTDNFAKIAQRHTPHVLSHSINLGKGAALKTGCDYAFRKLKADAVILMDSDDQHDPKEIHLFEKSLAKGNQVVFGARAFDENMPLLRIMVNRFASLLVSIMFGRYVPDIPSGYKAMTKHAYKVLKWNSSDYSVELEIAVRTVKSDIEFDVVPIKTIYHDLIRGMTILDGVRMISKLISWRLLI